MRFVVHLQHHLENGSSRNALASGANKTTAGERIGGRSGRRAATSPQTTATPSAATAAEVWRRAPDPPGRMRVASGALPGSPLRRHRDRMRRNAAAPPGRAPRPVGTLGRVKFDAVARRGSAPGSRALAEGIRKGIDGRVTRRPSVRRGQQGDENNHRE
jgi:hypothetical protein